ncbi:MAG: phosphate uptake regulator PhoU [Sulfuricurvum sp.]
MTLPKYEHKLGEIRRMVHDVLQSIIDSSVLMLDAYESDDDEAFSHACFRAEAIKPLTDTIDNEIIRTLALFSPEGSDLRYLLVYLKMTAEIDRIVRSMTKYCKSLNVASFERYKLNPHRASIAQLHKATLRILRYLADFFNGEGEQDANHLFRLIDIEESMTDDIFQVIDKDIMLMVMNNPSYAVEYVKTIGTLRNLEKIADRGVGIASLLRYAQDGGELHLRHSGGTEES